MNILIIDSNLQQTSSHEFLHTKGVSHSFTNKIADENAQYTYIYDMTDNIMDYSSSRYSLWKWQWKIANSNITNV